MKKYLILILTLLCFLSGCSQKPVQTETISNPRQEDLKYFCETLEKRHKNFYAKISKEEFGKEVEKIEKQTDNMTEVEFYFSLKHLLSLIGDAHTNVSYRKEPPLTILNFSIKEYEDGWYLMKLPETEKEHLGELLVSINGASIGTVYEKSKTIISYENKAWAKQMFLQIVTCKEALEYLGILKKDAPLILETKNKAGKISRLTLETENTSAIVKELKPEENPVTAFRKYELYWAEPLNEKIYFIQYNSCAEAEDFPMKDFAKKVKNDLKEGNYEKVILDIRYNGGGNSTIVKPLQKVLKKWKESTGQELYTLIGNSTFSSGVFCAVQMKEDLGAALVGQPTGGNVVSYGDIEGFELKNHPFQVTYSTKYFELLKGYSRDSFYPDFGVIPTLEDYLKGVDTEVEYILKLK